MGSGLPRCAREVGYSQGIPDFAKIMTSAASLRVYSGAVDDAFRTPLRCDKKGVMMKVRLIRPLFAVALGVATTALAQDKGTLDPKPLPPLTNVKDSKIPAKELFARKPLPTPTAPRAIGFYAHGCLAGGDGLPITSPTWQVMRLSRNRYWGHPNLIRSLKQLSENAAKAGWPGLLGGDMSQPRGGPMFTGHTSHQVGLDADIWLRPMPDRELTRQEREEMSANMMVADDRKDIDPTVWTPAHAAIIKA